MQRICICGTDSLTKSGKSTVSLTFSGKIYRFFAEIRHVLTRVLSPNFASLKAPPCLSKFTQTWREKPANSSDMVRFSGKSFRLDEKIRLAAGSHSAHATRLARNPSTSSAFAQETRYPHEIDTGLKSLVTCVRNLRTHPARPSASS